MNEATWALVGVTFILTILTGWYAYEAYRERAERNRPVLTFQLISWAPRIVKLRIQNVGNGAASNIKGTIESILNDGIASVPWSYSLLASGKYEEFGFPMPAGTATQDRFRLDTIKSKIIEVNANFTYKSVLGQSYLLQDSIKVQQLTDDWLSSKMLVTEDHPDRLLPHIAKALDGIAKALDELVRNTSK
ncbi:MAG: hypothetical protein ABSB31_07170 [Dehalococcoidia bacterium]|jgi:hypothetical protein